MSKKSDKTRNLGGRPETGRQRYNVMLDPRVVQAIDNVAKELKTTRSALMNEILRVKFAVSNAD